MKIQYSILQSSLVFDINDHFSLHPFVLMYILITNLILDNGLSENTV